MQMTKAKTEKPLCIRVIKEQAKEKAKLSKPIITVNIENYLRIIKLINLLEADLTGIESVFKALKYDEQQDAIKYSSKMHQDIARIRRIMFPGRNFD